MIIIDENFDIKKHVSNTVEFYRGNPKMILGNLINSFGHFKIGADEFVQYYKNHYMSRDCVEFLINKGTLPQNIAAIKNIKNYSEMINRNEYNREVISKIVDLGGIVNPNKGSRIQFKNYNYGYKVENGSKNDFAMKKVTINLSEGVSKNENVQTIIMANIENFFRVSGLNLDSVNIVRGEIEGRKNIVFKFYPNRNLTNIVIKDKNSQLLDVMNSELESRKDEIDKKKKEIEALQSDVDAISKTIEILKLN